MRNKWMRYIYVFDFGVVFLSRRQIEVLRASTPTTAVFFKLSLA
jgi:hypothetical protein